MSQVRKYDDGKFRISTSLTYERVKAIPDLNLPSLHRKHSAGSRSIIPANSIATPFKSSGIPLHEPCFVTKKPGYSLETVYLVNNITDDNLLKSVVESFLETFDIVPLTFDLNSGSNLIRLDRTLHHSLDRLGLAAITCSKTSLQAMLQIIEKENIEYDKERDYMRNLPLHEPPFSNAEYELVVLHPDHFLPAGSTINMHTEDPDDPSHLIGKLYMVGEDGALREGRESISPRFPAFSPSNLRAEDHRVNPLLVVLKADMVFRRFRRLGGKFTQSLCPEYAELVDLTIQLADALYYLPIARVAGGVYARYFPLQSGSSAQHETADSGTSQNHVSESRDNQDMTTTPKSRSGGLTGDTGRKREAVRYSRFGKEVCQPAPNASNEEARDFCRYIISGRGKYCDVPLNSHDEAILKSTGLYSELSDDEDNCLADK